MQKLGLKDGSVDKGRSTLTEDRGPEFCSQYSPQMIKKSVTLTSTDHIIPPHTHLKLIVKFYCDYTLQWE